MPANAREAQRHLPLFEPGPALAGLGLEPPRQRDELTRPRFAVWELTLRCTSRCRHCGSRAGEARPGELSVEESLLLADQFADLGVLELSLIGGEAFLHEGFLSVIERLSGRGVSVALVTGGVGVSADLALAAARAGLASVSVSIDGMGKTHDGLRGVRQGFEQALDALAHFRAAGVYSGINTQLNRQNWRELEQLTELVLRERVGAWQVSLTVPMGEAADRPELLLQPYDLLELVPQLARVQQRLAEHEVIFWPGNNVGYFGPHESTLRSGSHYKSCGAGRSVIGVEADGAVKGCPSLPTNAYSGGTVRQHSLRELWERSPALRRVRDRSSADLWGFCKTCYYAEACRGGCTWMSHTLLGRSGNNPYCHHRALELAKQGLRESVTLRQRAPGQPFDHGIFELVLEPLSVTPPGDPPCPS